MEETKKMYMTLLDRHNQRELIKYEIVNIDKKVDRDRLTPEQQACVKDNMLKSLVYKQNDIKDMEFVTEFWNRGGREVLIHKKAMLFQVDPHKRGQWINGEFYSLGFDLNVKPFRSALKGYIGAVKEDNSEKSLVTHSIYSPKDGEILVKMNMPMIYDSETVLFDKTATDGFLMMPPGGYRTNMYLGIRDKVDPNEPTIRDALYIDDNDRHKPTKDGRVWQPGYVINAFGRLSKFGYFLDTNKVPGYKIIHPLVAIKGTDENKKKYGANYITTLELQRLLVCVKHVIGNKNK